MRNQLAQSRTPDGRRKISVLWDEAAGSREAFKASRQFSLSNVYEFCETLPQFRQNMDDMLEKLPQLMEEQLEEIRRDKESR